MTNDTNVDINVAVKGEASLRSAADAVAKISTNLRDVASSLNSAIKGFDKLEQSLAGVSKGKKHIDSLTASVEKYNRVVSTVKGQSVTLQPTAVKPPQRNTLGQFVSPTIANANADRALAKNQENLEKARLAFGRVTEANHTFGAGIEQTGTRVQRFARSINDISGENLPRLRYALFDMAATLGIVTGALTLVTGATVKTAIEWERRFAEVQRTTGVTGEAAKALEADLIDLAQTLPISHEQISQIAALAGQLGIANDSVDAFTGTVAKFAATTDVTVEASATAFGRLDSLLPDVQGNFEGLGSSILNVGINSVATESQIVAITSQIAATGAQSGLAAGEVIGLAGALASLGVAPEAARGTVLRVFSQINSAIAQGGDRLENFARTAGMTADEFKSGWQDDFTDTFVKFLAGVGSQGASAETALRALGITAARDVNSMLKLAQNSEDVAEYLNLATDGFEQGTALGDNFAIVADTVAAKLQVLANTFQSLLAAAGNSVLPVLGNAIDLFTGFLKAIEDIISNPIGQWASGLALAFTGLAIVVGALGTSVAAGMGGWLAYRTAMQSAAVQGAATAATLRALDVVIKTTLASTGIGLAIALVGTLAAALVQLSSSASDASSKAKNYFGDLSSLSEAIKKDTAGGDAAGEAIGRVTTQIEEANKVTPQWAKELQKATGVNVKVAESVDGASNSVKDQTLVLRDNAKAWYANALATDENIQKVLASGKNIEGFSGQDFIAAILGDPVAGGRKYIDDLRAVFDAEAERLRQPFLAPETQEFFNEAGTAVDAYGASAQEAADRLALFNAVNSASGGILSDTTDELQARTDELLASVDVIYEQINAEAALADSTERLGRAFAENGGAVAASGAEMQAVIRQIIESTSSSQEAANRLQGLFDAIVAGGYASKAELTELLSVISILGGSTGSTPFNLKPFQQGVTAVRSVGRAASGAAKEVRTLLDYASDLGKVFSRAFDIRFGSQAALDKVTSQWRELTEELAEYQRRVQELTADRAVTSYFLQVAEAYGDTLRAGLLRSDLADIDAELADAQSGVSRELNGNSKAAIRNRATITDLISDYQEYIESLAASGASQATLQKAVARSRTDFIAQAQALGFSTTQLKPYIASFNDMKIAIDRVPRNITVRANTNPALQALNELEAAAKRLAGKTFPGPRITNPTNSKEIRRMALENAIATRTAWAAALRREGNIYGAMSTLNSIEAIRRQLQTGNYAAGGPVHGPGTATSDSIAANLSDGEYVIKAKSVAGIGIPLLNYLNKYGSLPGFASGGPVGNTTPTMVNGFMVELSPTDRRLLAAAGNVTLTIDGKIIADTANAVNGVYAKRGR